MLAMNQSLLLLARASLASIVALAGMGCASASGDSVAESEDDLRESASFTTWDFSGTSWPETTRATVTTGSSVANVYSFTSGPYGGCIHGISGDDGNEREWRLVPGLTATDSDIVSAWIGRTGGHAGQFGHVHRAIDLGKATQAAVMVWGDAYVGTPFLLNVNVWRGREAAFQPTADNDVPLIDIRTIGITEYPYLVRSRLRGSTVHVRVWKPGQSEPTAWQFARTLDGVPDGAGALGLLAPSHVAAGQFQCYGKANFRRLRLP